MEINEAIYKRLKDAAHHGELVTYGQIAPLAHLSMSNPGDRMRISEMLGAICTHEHEAGRPLLSVVVVSVEKRIPSQGFFTLARELGCYGGHTDAEDAEFFAAEVRKVHSYWLHMQP